MRAMIIDDEQHCIESIRLLLERHLPQVEIVAEIEDPEEALEAIRVKNPDLVFLDINMPGMTGFELIAKLRKIEFSIIFTTAYDQYAIKAFKVNAIDYLLKPVEPKELIEAVMNAEERLRKDQNYKHMGSLLSRMDHLLNAKEKISLPTVEGIAFIKVDDIIRCEADSNYTKVVARDQQYLVSKTLKEMEEELLNNDFFRVHHSYLINLKYIEMYQRGKGGVVVMSNGDHVDVSRGRKADFLNKM